jgi:hypothetical protein
LLTRTYLLPLLMQASVQSLSEVRSAWAARIFVWLTPHALSEIFPVHIAPKQDVASKAVAKVILEIIWNTPGKLDRHKWKVCPSKRKNAEGWATHHRMRQPETKHSEVSASYKARAMAAARVLSQGDQLKSMFGRPSRGSVSGARALCKLLLKPTIWCRTRS